MPREWDKTRRLVVARDNGICHLCGLPGAKSADHVIPHAMGGTDGMENLRAAHRNCNEKKGGRLEPVQPRASRFG